MDSPHPQAPFGRVVVTDEARKVLQAANRLLAEILTRHGVGFLGEPYNAMRSWRFGPVSSAIPTNHTGSYVYVYTCVDRCTTTVSVLTPKRS